MPKGRIFVRGALGVAAACVLLFAAGCGGVPELDSEEVATVSQARTATETAAVDGSLKPGDEKKFEDLIILCREKPLAEADGKSMREILQELAPRLSGADPELSSKMKRIATYGCK